MSVLPPGSPPQIFGAQLPSYDEVAAIKNAIQTAAQDSTCPWQNLAVEMWNQIQNETDLPTIQTTIDNIVGSVVQGDDVYMQYDLENDDLNSPALPSSLISILTAATADGDKWTPPHLVAATATDQYYYAISTNPPLTNPHVNAFRAAFENVIKTLGSQAASDDVVKGLINLIFSTQFFSFGIQEGDKADFYSYLNLDFHPIPEVLKPIFENLLQHPPWVDLVGSGSKLVNDWLAEVQKLWINGSPNPSQDLANWATNFITPPAANLFANYPGLSGSDLQWLAATSSTGGYTVTYPSWIGDYINVGYYVIAHPGNAFAQSVWSYMQTNWSHGYDEWYLQEALRGYILNDRNISQQDVSNINDAMGLLNDTIPQDLLTSYIDTYNWYKNLPDADERNLAYLLIGSFNTQILQEGGDTLQGAINGFNADFSDPLIAANICAPLTLAEVDDVLKQIGEDTKVNQDFLQAYLNIAKTLSQTLDASTNKLMGQLVAYMGNKLLTGTVDDSWTHWKGQLTNSNLFANYPGLTGADFVTMVGLFPTQSIDSGFATAYCTVGYWLQNNPTDPSAPFVQAFLSYMQNEFPSGDVGGLQKLVKDYIFGGYDYNKGEPSVAGITQLMKFAGETAPAYLQHILDICYWEATTTTNLTAKPLVQSLINYMETLWPDSSGNWTSIQNWAVQTQIFDLNSYKNSPNLSSDDFKWYYSYVEGGTPPPAVAENLWATGMWNAGLDPTSGAYKLASDLFGEIKKIFSDSTAPAELQTWTQNQLFDINFFKTYANLTNKDLLAFFNSAGYTTIPSWTQDYLNVGYYMASNPDNAFAKEIFSYMKAQWPNSSEKDLQTDLRTYITNDTTLSSADIPNINTAMGLIGDSIDQTFLKDYVNCSAWYNNLTDANEKPLAGVLIKALQDQIIGFGSEQDAIGAFNSNFSSVSFATQTCSSLSVQEVDDVLKQIGEDTKVDQQFLATYLKAASLLAAPPPAASPTLAALLTLMIEHMGKEWLTGTLSEAQTYTNGLMTDPNFFTNYTQTQYIDIYDVLGVVSETIDPNFLQQYLIVGYTIAAGQTDPLTQALFTEMRREFPSGDTAELQTWAKDYIFGGYDYKDLGEPTVDSITNLLNLVLESPPPYLQQVLDICNWQATTATNLTAKPLVQNLIDHMESLWPDNSGSWSSIQNWVQSTGQIFDPKFFTTYAGLNQTDFNYYLTNIAGFSSLPALADDYFNVGSWLVNASTDAAGQKLAQYLVNDIETNWSTWQPSDLAADVKKQVLASGFFTTYSGVTLDDFNHFMSYGSYTPPDKILAGAYFNFGTWLAKGDADASFYQTFRDKAIALWDSSPAFTALQDFGQGYINAAFLDSSNNPPTYSEAAAINMENFLDVGITGHFTPPSSKLQDSLFEVFAFMKGKDHSSQDYQFGLKFIQFAFLGQGAPSGWTVAWPTKDIPTLQAFLNNWFATPAGSGVTQDPYLMFPEAPLADIQGFFTSMGLTYAAPSTIDAKCATAVGYLQGLVAGSDDAKLFNQLIAAYQALGSQQGVANPSYASLLTWADPVIAGGFSAYPNILAASKTEFINEVGDIGNQEATAIKDAFQTAAQDPTCTWQQLATTIWNKIQNETNLITIQNDIDNIVGSNVQGDDVYMQYDLSTTALNDPGNPKSLISILTAATAGGDKWTPPHLVDATATDLFYVTSVNLPITNPHVNAFRVAFDNVIKTLGSQATSDDVVKGLINLIFSTQFFAFGIQEGDKADFYSYLKGIFHPIPDALQPIFDSLLQHPPWVDMNDSGKKLVNDWLAEIQSLWINGSANPAQDLANWATNFITPPATNLFNNYPGLTVTDLQWLASSSSTGGYTVTYPSWIGDYLNVGYYVIAHPDNAFAQSVWSDMQTNWSHSYDEWHFQEDLRDYITKDSNISQQDVSNINDAMGLLNDSIPQDLLTSYIDRYNWFKNLPRTDDERKLADLLVGAFQTQVLQTGSGTLQAAIDAFNADFSDPLIAANICGPLTLAEVDDVLKQIGEDTKVNQDFLQVYLNTAKALSQTPDASTSKLMGQLVAYMGNELLTGTVDDSWTHWKGLLTNSTLFANYPGLTGADFVTMVGLFPTQSIDTSFATAYCNVGYWLQNNPTDPSAPFVQAFFSYMQNEFPSGDVGGLQKLVKSYIFGGYDYSKGEPSVTGITKLMSFAGETAPAYLQHILDICYWEATTTTNLTAKPLVQSLINYMETLWPDSSGNWTSIQNWVQSTGQIFDPKFFTTYAGLSQTDFNYYLTNIAGFSSLPALADDYFNAGSWLANASTDAAGQKLAQYLVNDIETNWSTWQPSDLAADVKKQVLSSDFFTTYSGMTLNDFKNFMSYGSYTPPDTNLSTAYFNFGTSLAKGDADASFYQVFLNYAHDNWDAVPPAGYTGLQNLGQGYINSAFLDVNNNLVSDKAGALNMETFLNIASPQLQDALFQVYAFMKDKGPSSQDYQVALKLVQFAFLGQNAPAGWTKAWPTGTLPTLQAFLNNWFMTPSGSGVIDDPYLMFPEAPIADVQSLFTSLGLTYSNPSAVDQQCEAAVNYLQNTILPGPGAGSSDATLFNQLIAQYQALGSQQGVANPSYASLFAWGGPIIANGFSSYPNILAATKTEFTNIIGTIQDQEVKDIKNAIQTAAQDPTCTWQQLAIAIWDKIQNETDLGKLETDIDTIVGSNVQNDDIYMQYDLSTHDLNDLTNPNSLMSMLTAATAGGDKWVPPHLPSDATKEDVYYWEITHLPQVPNPHVNQFRTALESAIKTLGSAATALDTQKAIANLVFNPNFIASYGIGSSDAGDFYSYLSGIHMPMSAGLQTIFTTFLNSQSYVTGTNPTANSWLAEVQNLWINDSAAPVSDLAAWAKSQVQNVNFFTTYLNISLADLNEFLTMSGASFTDSSVASAFWNAGTALAGMAAKDPGHDFYLAFFTEAGTLSNGHLSDLASWLTNSDDGLNKAKGLYDLQFWVDYGQNGRVSDSQVTTLLGWAGVTTPSFLTQYLNMVATNWFANESQTTAFNFAGDLIQYMRHNQSDTVSQIQTLLEQEIANPTTMFTGLAPGLNMNATDFQGVLTQIGLTAPDYAAEYLWVGSALNGAPAPDTSMQYLLTQIINMMVGFLAAGPTWPAGSLAQVQTAGGGILGDINQYLNNFSGASVSEIQDFVQYGLGCTQPDIAYVQGYLMAGAYASGSSLMIDLFAHMGQSMGQGHSSIGEVEAYEEKRLSEVSTYSTPITLATLTAYLNVVGWAPPDYAQNLLNYGNLLYTEGASAPPIGAGLLTEMANEIGSGSFTDIEKWQTSQIFSGTMDFTKFTITDFVNYVEAAYPTGKYPNLITATYWAEHWQATDSNAAKLASALVGQVQSWWVDATKTQANITNWMTGVICSANFFTTYSGLTTADFDTDFINGTDVILPSWFGDYLKVGYGTISNPNNRVLAILLPLMAAAWTGGTEKQFRDDIRSTISSPAFMTAHPAVLAQDIIDAMDDVNDTPPDFVNNWPAVCQWFEALDTGGSEYPLANQLMLVYSNAIQNYQNLSDVQAAFNAKLADPNFAKTYCTGSTFTGFTLLDVLKQDGEGNADIDLLSCYVNAVLLLNDPNQDPTAKLLISDLIPDMGTHINTWKLQDAVNDWIKMMVDPKFFAGPGRALSLTGLVSMANVFYVHMEDGFAVAFLKAGADLVAGPGQVMIQALMTKIRAEFPSGTLSDLQTWSTGYIFGDPPDGWAYSPTNVPTVEMVNHLLSYFGSSTAPSYFTPDLTNVLIWVANPSSMGVWGQETPDSDLIALVHTLRDHLEALWPDSSGTWSSIQSWVQGYPGGQIFDPNFFKTYGTNLTAADLSWYLSFPVEIQPAPALTENYFNAGSWLAKASTDAPGLAMAQYLVTDIEGKWTDATGPAELAADVKGQVLSSSFFTGPYVGMTLADFNDFMAYGGYTPPDTNLSTAYYNFGTWLAKGDADASFYQVFLNYAHDNWDTASPAGYNGLQDLGEGYIKAAFLDPGGKAPTYSEAAVNKMEAWLNAVPSSHFTPPADQKLQDALFAIYTWVGTDSTTPKYEYGVYFVQFAFLGTTTPPPPSAWGGPTWPKGSLATTMTTFMNDWFNPPSGSTIIDDPFLVGATVSASDIEALFTNMGLTLSPYSTPSMIDQYAETAGAYLYGTILAKSGPGPTSIDAKFFSDFITMYQSAGSQQSAGASPDLNTIIIPWVEKVLFNNFKDYPGILAATKIEFYSEVKTFYPNVVLYQDRNYVQDWLTQWPEAPPAPTEDPYRYNKLFGQNLLEKMDIYLTPGGSPTIAGFQIYLSSYFFRDIPDLFPPNGPQTPGYPPPGMQFSDVTTLLSNFHSFTSYPTYAAWVVVVNDRNAAHDTAGQALFQSLMDQFNMARYATGLSTLTSPPTFWRDDPSIQTNIVPMWMTLVTQGTMMWQDDSGNYYTWSSSPPVPSLVDQTAFKAIMAMPS